MTSAVAGLKALESAMLFPINLDKPHARRAAMHAPLDEIGLSDQRIGIEFRQPGIRHPIDHSPGGSRAGAVKPRIAVLRPAVIHENEWLGAQSQIEPTTYLFDRARIVELARRPIIASRMSAFSYRLHRHL